MKHAITRYFPIYVMKRICRCVFIILSRLAIVCQCTEFYPGYFLALFMNKLQGLFTITIFNNSRLTIMRTKSEKCETSA